VFENLEDGMTIDEVLEQFPVTREQVKAVLECANLPPLADRPPSLAVNSGERRWAVITFAASFGWQASASSHPPTAKVDVPVLAMSLSVLCGKFCNPIHRF